MTGRLARRSVAPHHVVLSLPAAAPTRVSPSARVSLPGCRVLKGFVMLVLFLLVGRTARALGPFVDETGRLLRDCVAYPRKGLHRLFGEPGRRG